MPEDKMPKNKPEKGVAGEDTGGKAKSGTEKEKICSDR